jgi:hypothetical protein
VNLAIQIAPPAEAIIQLDDAGGQAQQVQRLALPGRLTRRIWRRDSTRSVCRTSSSPMMSGSPSSMWKTTSTPRPRGSTSEDTRAWR